MRFLPILCVKKFASCERKRDGESLVRPGMRVFLFHGSAFCIHRRNWRTIRSPWTFPAVSTLSHREKPRRSREPSSSLAKRQQQRNDSGTTASIRRKPCGNWWQIYALPRVRTCRPKFSATRPRRAPESFFSAIRLIRGLLQHLLQ